jgi:hypothetical protein
MDHLEIARLLVSRRSQIVDQTVTMVMQNPFWIERVGDGAREKTVVDIEYTFDTLVKTVRYCSPMILEDYVVWLRGILINLRASTGLALRQSFAFLWSAISSQMPEESFPTLYDYIQAALQVLNFTDPRAQQLLLAQEYLADELVAATYDRHWHWQAAYSTEGRQRARFDAWLGLDYLVDSLGTHREDNFFRHVRWMREHFIKHGLSTAHVQQWLWMLGLIGEQRLPPEVASELRRILELGITALQYEDPNYQALAAAQDALVKDVAKQLLDHGLFPQMEQAMAEVGWYLAYLGDSLATNDSANLIGYTRWVKQWLASYGLPDTPLRQSYTILSDALPRHLPANVASTATALLRAAQGTL